MLLRRLVILAYALALVGAAVGSTLFFWQTRREYVRLRAIEQRVEQRLAETELKLAEQEEILRRLRTDPAYVERVIRRRLGYARPDEFVWRFEE
ncbi:MAG: septum formation initiator family protein [Verrucomicrobiota bacterium]